MFKDILVSAKKYKNGDHSKALDFVLSKLKTYPVDYAFAFAENLIINKFKNKDLTIVLGGDGTLLNTAYFVSTIPIFGINSDTQHSRGVLMEQSPISLDEKLKKLFDGDFSIKERTRLEGYLNSEPIGLALNEFYIGTTRPFGKGSRYTIFVNEKKESQVSAGVLISTGTGSTGVFKNFGEKFPEDVDYAKFKVIAPYEKYELLSGDVKEIKFISETTKNGLITIDGFKDFEFDKPSELKIKISDKPLRCIVFR